MFREERAYGALGVVSMAGPRVTVRGERQARSHGIELDVALAGHEVALRVDDAGLEPSFPKRPRSIVYRVDYPHVASAQVLHQERDCAFSGRCEQQMNVIGRQNVRMYRALSMRGELREQLEVVPPISVAEEARRAVDAALNDVNRNTREV